eukprot:4981952-Prymnesium_polylepis.1
MSNFELSDDEASRVLTVVRGRPNFLKTTGMCCGGRAAHDTHSSGRRWLHRSPVSSPTPRTSAPLRQLWRSA